ncbi:CoA transferase [Bradyrhizobium sp. RDT10]
MLASTRRLNVLRAALPWPKSCSRSSGPGRATIGSTSWERPAFRAARSRTVGEVCEAPQLVERDMVQTVTHRVAGDVKFVARPLRFDDQPPAPSTPPPTLGEHTVEVFEDWLGWTRTIVSDYGSRARSARPR